MAHLRAYADLLRIHFFFAWPILFCSGYALAAAGYGSFSWMDFTRAAFIGLFGFEAGLVLNDYIDREYDRRDTEFGKLTRYWRLFGTRPLPAGHISSRNALFLFLILAGCALILIATLPFPHSLLVSVILVYSYAVEAFYQVKKREQAFPVAQLIGRTDFALFPVAGYLCTGFPDLTVLSYFLFFYPFAMAHLGVNDLIDIVNDQARGMKTIAILYGIPGTIRWILGFTLVHIACAWIFISGLPLIAVAGVAGGLFLVIVSSVYLVLRPTPEAGLRILPLFHLAMLVYAGSIILGTLPG